MYIYVNIYNVYIFIYENKNLWYSKLDKRKECYVQVPKMR